MNNKNQYPLLFSEGTIGRLTLKNRIVMPSMEVGMANFDGTLSDQIMDYYEERAKNGVAMIVSGICRVNDLTGAAVPRQIALSRDIQIDSFATAARRIQRHGTKFVAELHHPGRQNHALMMYGWPVVQRIAMAWPGFANYFEKLGPLGMDLSHKYGGPAVVAPSAVRCNFVNARPRRLTGWEIKGLIKAFVRAAKRAQLAGLDGVMLHAAHGYLMQQFLSTHTNKRNDAYGNSLENRLRFITEIIDSIRATCGPDFPLMVRLSVDEYYRYLGERDLGIELEEGVRIARALEKTGIHALDISSGTYETLNSWCEPTSFEPGWRKNLAAAVRQEVDIPVIAANLIRSAAQAEQQLAEGTQDFVALGRPFLADPEWVNKVREGREHEIKRCIMCCRCFESLNENAAKGQILECSINPRLGHEQTPLPSIDNRDNRPVAIIGAGPAGLSAAETLGRCGLDCVVFEKNPEVGGQVHLASNTPDKEKIAWCCEDLQTNAEKYGAKIRLGCEANIAALKELDPRAIIVATGGKAIVPPIKGVDQAHVCTNTEILDNSVQLENKRVAVIGSGLTGLETAKKLAAKGNEVMVVEMLDTIGPNGNQQHIDDVLMRLKKYNPTYMTSQKLVEITGEHIVLEDIRQGGRSNHKADAVVLAVGVRSNNGIIAELEKEFAHVIPVGDARTPGRIGDAIHEGFQVAWKLKDS